MRLRVVLIVLALFFSGEVPSQAQDLPPCAERPTFIDPPQVNGNLWCLEQVIQDDSGGELAFTALAAAPDGTLYAARPLHGQILALNDTDGNGLPDSPHVVADGLTLPNGLVYHDGVLYVSGGSHIYRLNDDKVETLVDDLPTGTGFWTGGITVGEDGRLYVAIGAPCDWCEPDDPTRGAILSFNLDGGDRQIVARGLRQPADVTFLNGVLWTADTARDGLADTPDLDELNRVEPGAFFGWPYCIGQDNRRDWPSDVFNCADAVPPALVFPTHSAPLGLAAYTSDTFPVIKNSLLVVLRGSYNQAALHGFALAVVTFGNMHTPTGYRIIVPERVDKTDPPGRELERLLYRGSGTWPHYMFDVTVSSQGWIYFSSGGGRILVLRPNE
jgi:glucose/arabinose dehydrogenase